MQRELLLCIRTYTETRSDSFNIICKSSFQTINLRCTRNPTILARALEAINQGGHILCGGVSQVKGMGRLELLRAPIGALCQWNDPLGQSSLLYQTPALFTEDR